MGVENMLIHPFLGIKYVRISFYSASNRIKTKKLLSVASIWTWIQLNFNIGTKHAICVLCVWFLVLQSSNFQNLGLHNFGWVVLVLFDWHIVCSLPECVGYFFCTTWLDRWMSLCGPLHPTAQIHLNPTLLIFTLMNHDHHWYNIISVFE